MKNFFKKRCRQITMLSFFLFGAWFLFSGATAVHAETCTWTAASSTDMSTSTNWSGCTLSSDDDLVFDSTTTTNATWDTAFTQIATVTVDSGYTGTITIGAAAATTTGNFTMSDGLVTSTATGLFKIGGNLTVNTGARFAGDVTGNVELYGTSKTLGGAGSIIFYDLTVNGSVALTGNVTSTNLLTINSSKSLDAGGYKINLSKDSGTPLVINGTFTAGTSTVSFDAATDATIAGTTYYNLTVNAASSTFGGNVTSTNLLTINASKTLNAGSVTIQLSKDSG
ncbi:MAG: hypothetical protein HYV41_04880, partial [Candidatus Magasanikbacteria bacterium]|nr:hypothetical protein [Candidatus Magasanikbacteria bacterium]